MGPVHGFGDRAVCNVVDEAGDDQLVRCPGCGGGVARYRLRAVIGLDSAQRTQTRLFDDVVLLVDSMIACLRLSFLSELGGHRAGRRPSAIPRGTGTGRRLNSALFALDRTAGTDPAGC